MKKKLLVIVPYFYPHKGGVENYSYQMSRMVKKLFKWDIVIITTHNNRTKTSIEKIDGMKVYRLPYWFKISNSPINPLWFTSIKEIIEKEKPTIINAHSPVLFMADVSALVCGNIPFILTYHSGSLRKGKLLPDVVISLYEKYMLPRLFKRSNKVIFTSSKPIIKNIERYGRKIHYITPGVDMASFKPYQKHAKNTILYVGRIEKNSHWKGINYLMDAVKLLLRNNPDSKLHLVGEGDEMLDYIAYAKKIGIEKNVIFFGSLVGKSLRDAYAKASVVVLPSISDSESFGTVLIEAMAMKKPVIGSHIGGISYVIDHRKTGLLVPPKNPVALAKALKTILGDKKLAKKMGEQGYKKVMKSYRWEQQGELFMQTIQPLYERKHAIKLLLVSPYFPSHIGGVELYVKNIAERLVKTYDIGVIIITSNHEEKKTVIEKKDDITIYRLASMFTFSNTPINPFWYFQIKNIIAKEKPNIINAHAPVPFMADITALASNNIPFILTYHTGKMRKNNYLQSILLNFYEKTLFTYTRNKAKKIICPSSYVREQFHDASKNKISVISPGVDTEKFKPIRKTHNYQILFVGSLQKVEAYKGLSYLLESFSQISKQFPKARLKVVGDGSARRHYEKVALKLGISDYVTFSGIITGDELVSVYQHADVLVLPSLFESFGMVFIEAMACSLPVIGTRVGGIPDVISHNKNGLLVAPGDIPALTRAIADILSNPAKANEMGNNGYEKVKASYAWDKQVEKTHGVITSLIN